MTDFDHNQALREIAEGRGAPCIGLQFTITDEGETSFSLNLAGHSIPVVDSDAHALTMAELAQKYL